MPRRLRRPATGTPSARATSGAPAASGRSARTAWSARPSGFQCPDCVREGKATVREARTLAGGAIHGDPVLVTKILLAANVGLFILQFVTNDRVTARFAMQGFAVAIDGEYYRLITSAFLHTGVTHLAFNMLALWFVGSAIEPRLGRWRYLTVYLLSALGGSVLSYAVDSPFQSSVGASGAVFGLFGALFVLMRRLRFDVGGVVGLIAHQRGDRLRSGAQHQLARPPGRSHRRNAAHSGDGLRASATSTYCLDRSIGCGRGDLCCRHRVAH